MCFGMGSMPHLWDGDHALLCGMGITSTFWDVEHPLLCGVGNMPCTLGWGACPCFMGGDNPLHFGIGNIPCILGWIPTPALYGGKHLHILGCQASHGAGLGARSGPAPLDNLLVGPRRAEPPNLLIAAGLSLGAGYLCG